MIRTIETHPLGTIQKITTPKGAARFQVVFINGEGDGFGDSSQVVPCKSLVEARTKLGVVIQHPEKRTTPKAECQHNRPGYRADSAARSSGKGKK